MQPLTHAEAIARLGPRPHGDVEGMRGLAAAIRSLAGRLDARTNIRLDNWDSDRAREVKDRIHRAGRAAESAGAWLGAAAALLEREAADLDTEQSRWAGRYAALTGVRPGP